VGDGTMNEGFTSTELGLKGIRVLPKISRLPERPCWLNIPVRRFISPMFPPGDR